jgi:branched-chain amino acid transport system permease protein
MITWFGADLANFFGYVFLLLTLVVVMFAAAGVNMAAERVAYRRLRRAPKLAPLITAVGLSFSYQWAGIRLNGSGPRNWVRILGDTGFSIGGVQVRWSTIVVIGITVPLLLLMTYIVQRTRQGKAMRATAQDQDAAAMMGINVNRTISFTFLLAGALGGAGGLIYVMYQGQIRFDDGFNLGLIAFTAAVLGGIGNMPGAALGGFAIGFLSAWSDQYISARWTNALVFAILILVLVFRPQGLLGERTPDKV